MERDPLVSTAPITPGLPKTDAMAALLCKLDSQVNKHLASATQRRPTATAANATNGCAVTPSPQQQQQQQLARPIKRARWLTPTFATLLVSMLCGPALVWWGVSAEHESQGASAAPASPAPNQPAGPKPPQQKPQPQLEPPPPPSLVPEAAPSPAPIVAAQTTATSSPASTAQPTCSDARTALGLCPTTTR